MSVRKIIIDKHETNHTVATIYATVYDNGLVDVRRSVRQKLDGNENDLPENRLTIDQHKLLIKLVEAPKLYECPHLGCDNVTSKTRVQMRNHLEYWHNSTPSEIDEVIDAQ